MELRVSDWISPGVGKANCRRVRIGVDGREWLSVLKNRVVSVLRANQCRLGMRIDVGTNANTHLSKEIPAIHHEVNGIYGHAESRQSWRPWGMCVVDTEWLD